MFYCDKTLELWKSGQSSNMYDKYVFKFYNANALTMKSNLTSFLKQQHSEIHNMWV